MINTHLVNILIQLVICLFGSLGVACWTMVVDFCIGEPRVEEVKRGRIFTNIGAWMRRKYLEFDYKEQGRINKAPAEMRDRLFKIPNPYKAMGICPICSNIWWGFIFTAPFFILTGIDWWFFFLFIPFSNTILRNILRA